MSSQIIPIILSAFTLGVVSNDLVDNVHFHSNPDTQLKACLTSDISTCTIHCDYHNCRYYKLLITDETPNISSITLNCQHPSSCYGLELHILDSIYCININQISINCGPNSCQDLILYAYNTKMSMCQIIIIRTAINATINSLSYDTMGPYTTL